MSVVGSLPLSFPRVAAHPACLEPQQLTLGTELLQLQGFLTPAELVPVQLFSSGDSVGDI